MVNQPNREENEMKSDIDLINMYKDEKALVIGDTVPFNIWMDSK